MIQSTSYNLTDKESTLLKVSAKMFKDDHDFFAFIESTGIRSLIDTGSNEYKLMMKGFPKTEEGEIQKIWYKLIYILSAFHNRIDFKSLIDENVKRMLRSYSDYEEYVKGALSEYIIFLRIGSTCYHLELELALNMTIESLVDLLEDELSLRTRLYKNNSDEMIVEIATIHYDYDAIKKEFKVDGICCYDLKDEEYIKYISTAEHTKRIINYRRMIASMYAI